MIANPKMLVNISKVQGKDAIRVHCNIRVKILDRVGDLSGYGTVWYKPTGIANILLMSRARNFGLSSTARVEIFHDSPPRQGCNVSAKPQQAKIF